MFYLCPRDSRDRGSKFSVQSQKILEIISPTLSQVSWNKVYEAWKEMTNALIRGYTNYGFEAWTVPCLYVAGKYMRVFAIKADESAANGNGLPTHFGDDISPEAEKNENLQDAARQLNRIFTICLSDRLVSPFQSESDLANSWQSTS
jgi:hypothetical protein